MKRRGFLKAIAGVCGTAVLPAKIFSHQQKIYLLHCYVRGFRFYEGDELLPRMRRGDVLQLVREPQNTFDSNAIALHYQNHKIGFIPRESNDVMSKLMDDGTLQIEAEITHVQPDADLWEQVQIAVYLVKDT